MTAERRDPRTHCAMCGAPIATCTVPGLHGMIRDRARAGAEQLHGPARRTFQAKELTR